MKKLIIFLIFVPIILVFAIITLSIWTTIKGGEVETQTNNDTSGIPSYLYSNTSADEIIVDIIEGQIISSPLSITGRARGSWFFEATAPVSIVNWDGLIIGQGYIQTIGDWMTEDFVEFSGVIEFEKPTYKNNGAIILQASNPSDLPQNGKALEIPILFAE